MIQNVAFLNPFKIHMLMDVATTRECYFMLKLLHEKYKHVFIWFNIGIWGENDFIIRHSLFSFCVMGL